MTLMYRTRTSPCLRWSQNIQYNMLCRYLQVSSLMVMCVFRYPCFGTTNLSHFLVFLSPSVFFFHSPAESTQPTFIVCKWRTTTRARWCLSSYPNHNFLMPIEMERSLTRGDKMGYCYWEAIFLFGSLSALFDIFRSSGDLLQFEDCRMR